MTWSSRWWNVGATSVAGVVGLGVLAGCSSDGGSSPGSSAASPRSRPVLFVGNVADGTVSLIETDTLKVIGELNVIPDGDTPRDPKQASIYPAIVQSKGVNFVQGIAVSPDAHTLYASRGYLGDVAAFDLASGSMRWRVQAEGLRADHIALSSDGQRVFLSDITADKVQVIDARSGAIVGSFPAGTYPHVLELTPDQALLAVGSMGDTSAAPGQEGERSLSFVDPDSLTIARTLRFDAGVRPFVFSRDGATVYLQLSFFNGFLAVDATSGEIETTIDLPISGPAKDMAPEDYPNQAAHHGIALSGDGATLCEAATVSNYVALIDASTLAVLATVPVGDQPASAQTSLDGRACFVSNRGQDSNAVSVISYADRREIARIAVGTRPQELTQARVPIDVLRAAGASPD